MKQLFFAAVTLLLSFAAIAQGTTQDEYTYVTKGYIRVLTESQDVKSGYKIVKGYTSNPEASTWGNMNRFQFSYLVTAANDLRATIVEHYVNNKLQTVYCLPNNTAPVNLWQDYFAKVNLLATDQKTMLIKCYSILYADVVQKLWVKQ